MKSVSKWKTAAILGAAALLVFVVVAVAQTLPDGPGKQLVQDTCASSCHGAESWSELRMSKEDWRPLVTDMVSRGEAKTDKEIETMLDYLAKNFGPEEKGDSKGTQPDKINVNKAPSKELAAFFDITPKDADAIVQYREKNGDFKTIEDLKKVPGVDDKKIDSKKDKLEF